MKAEKNALWSIQILKYKSQRKHAHKWNSAHSQFMIAGKVAPTDKFCLNLGLKTSQGPVIKNLPLWDSEWQVPGSNHSDCPDSVEIGPSEMGATMLLF